MTYISFVQEFNITSRQVDDRGGNSCIKKDGGASRAFKGLQPQIVIATAFKDLLGYWVDKWIGAENMLFWELVRLRGEKRSPLRYLLEALFKNLVVLPPPKELWIYLSKCLEKPLIL